MQLSTSNNVIPSPDWPSEGSDIKGKEIKDVDEVFRICRYAMKDQGCSSIRAGWAD